MPSETILKISELNAPAFFEGSFEEEQFCVMPEGQHIRKLGDLHTLTETYAGTNRNLSGFSARKPSYYISAHKERTILHGNAANAGANILGVNLYPDGREFPVIFDFDSGFGVECFAFVNNCLYDQFWKKGNPCNI